MAIAKQATNRISNYSLESDPAFMEFVNSLRSQATVSYYVFALKRYMQFLGVKSCQELIRKDLKLIQSDIVKYVVEDRSVAPSTMRSYVAALKTFYVQNDITNISWKKITTRLQQFRKAHDDRAYTIEEIRSLIDNSDRRSKVIVYLLSSTGMRIGALAELRRKHLKLVRQDGYEFYQITVYAGTKDEYTTFCSQECKLAIDDYLKFRADKGETIKPETPIMRESLNKIGATEDIAKDIAQYQINKRLLARCNEAVEELMTSVRTAGNIPHGACDSCIGKYEGKESKKFRQELTAL